MEPELFCIERTRSVRDRKRVSAGMCVYVQEDTKICTLKKTVDKFM